jgi:hypothetical protein
MTPVVPSSQSMTAGSRSGLVYENSWKNIDKANVLRLLESRRHNANCDGYKPVRHPCGESNTKTLRETIHIRKLALIAVPLVS